jgi:hypothetical protein
MTADDIAAALTPEERTAAVRLAMGRILKLGSRPAQPGDVEEYERCRLVILACSPSPRPDHRPDAARDRGRGDVSQW